MATLISLLAAFLLPTLALAQTTGLYQLIQPLPGIPATTSLSDYLSGIIRLTIGIAGVIAVVRIVICGIQLLMSNSVSARSAAKECITEALFGLILAIGSWVILNTINPVLLNKDLNIIGLVTPAPITKVISTNEPPVPTGNGYYFKYKRLSTGQIAYARAGTGEMCEALRKDYQRDSDVEVLSSCFSPSAGQTSGSASAPPTTSGIQCPLSGLNLCQPQYSQCTAPTCAQFAGMANKYASGAVSAAMIKAMIFKESTCGQNLTGDGGRSCGPIHIQPATANKYLNQCGLTNAVDCGWLSLPENWDKAVCLSAAYLDAIAQTSCGSETRNIIAGYNGGAGVCQTSSDCGSEQSCSGTSVKKWECLYDNSQHTQCNAGYDTTRNYVTKILYCMQNPGY